MSEKWSLKEKGRLCAPQDQGERRGFAGIVEVQRLGLVKHSTTKMQSVIEKCALLFL